jgi:hypothetical protein
MLLCGDECVLYPSDAITHPYDDKKDLFCRYLRFFHHPSSLTTNSMIMSSPLCTCNPVLSTHALLSSSFHKLAHALPFTCALGSSFYVDAMLPGTSQQRMSGPYVHTQSATQVAPPPHTKRPLRCPCLRPMHLPQWLTTVVRPTSLQHTASKHL